MRARPVCMTLALLLAGGCGGNEVNSSPDEALMTQVAPTSLGPVTVSTSTATPDTTEASTPGTVEEESTLPHEVVLELTVFDWTESNPPGAVAIVIGSQTWEPDLEFGGDGADLGSFEVGVPGSFTVYPDGLGGDGVEVQFVMTDEMVAKSGSDEMMTHVEIHDSEIQVWGHAIPGLEAYYDR